MRAEAVHMAAGGLTAVEEETGLPALVVKWPAGVHGTQDVTLQLPDLQAASLQQQALLVAVSSVSNAALDRQRSTTVISAVPWLELTTNFTMQANQVTAVAAYAPACHAGGVIQTCWQQA